MRPFKIGLAAAVIIALAGLSGVSLAAKKGGGGAVDAKARTQGMAEAPAVAKSLGLSCNVTDARFVGKSEDRKTKTSSTFYEVDCDQGPGMILQANSDGKNASFTCVEIASASSSGLSCILPGNANPAADLGPVLAKNGVQCTPEKARGIGQNATSTFMEVLCPGNVGYILVASAPFDANKKIEAQNCLAYDAADGNIKCELGTKESRLAVVDSYVAKAASSCTVKDRRFIGLSTEGSTFYEASCQDGKGYVIKLDKAGATTAMDCAKAQNIMGGCTLTDTRQAATEQAALYTKLSTAAGFACDVDSYAAFPSPPDRPNDDVVELVCKSGKGGIGVFQPGGKGTVYDCGRALVAGYKCSKNKPDSGYAALTEDLRKFNVKTCTVSNSRIVGKTAKGTVLVEVGCSDGLKGYMLEYNATPVTAVGATGCAFTGGCKLPGNT